MNHVEVKRKMVKCVTEIGNALTGELSDWEVECAIYWCCANYYSGMVSVLYKIMCNSPYKPSSSEDGPDCIGGVVLATHSALCLENWEE